MPPVPLLCPVRNCHSPLTRVERSWTCPRGHSFDVARSGYCNLLQPQDSKSRQPGDSREAAEARRRLFAAGHSAPLLREILELLEGLPERAAVLDVGCGEGSMLGGLARERPVEAHGIDISVPSIELAARAFPEATWIVGNADRFLSYGDGDFAAVMSLTARLHPAEMRRVLAPDGRLIVAVAGPDDLIELREALLGEGAVRDRLERAAAELAGRFEMEERRTVRHTAHLDPAEVRDVLASSYRGARESEQRRLEDLAGMAVTFSREIGLFRPL
jgi:23S rRNA (guanine745-N1)-methyltransferase